MKLSASVFALGLTTIVLAIFIVPFTVWNTDHAAQFFGSFFAAILAAAAAFSGYFLQHKLTIAREKQSHHQKAYQDITDLYFWLRHIQSRLLRMKKSVEQKLSGANQPKDENESFFAFSKIDIKRMDFADVLKIAADRISCAFHLPSDLRASVVETIYTLCEMADDFTIATAADINEKVSRRTVANLKPFYENHFAKVKDVTDQVEIYMKANFIFPAESSQ
jgi:hypothetical protein